MTSAPQNPAPDAQPYGQPAAPQQPQQPQPAGTQKAGRFDNANWFARGSLALMGLSLVLGSRIPVLALICLIASIGLAIYALVGKKAPKTERWVAWVTIGFFIFQIIATIILLVMAPELLEQAI